MAQKRRTRNKPAKSILFKPWFWIIIILVAAAGGFILAYSKPAAPAATATQAVVPEITVAEAYQKEQQGVFLLDVRQPEEWQQGHIASATLIPLGELSQRLNELPKDREIVVVCRTGHRSRQGASILIQAGFPQVESMAGGVTAWTAAGYPLVPGQ